MLLVIGSILGFVSVSFGAYSEHGLKPVVTEEQFRFLMTAIRYNQVYAVAVAGIGLLQITTDLTRFRGVAISGWIFAVGTVLFSFSIYAAVFFDAPALTMLTPVGGITMMLGWIVLGLVGVRSLLRRGE